jgi:hypothetical protein
MISLRQKFAPRERRGLTGPGRRPPNLLQAGAAEGFQIVRAPDKLAADAKRDIAPSYDRSDDFVLATVMTTESLIDATISQLPDQRRDETDEAFLGRIIDAVRGELQRVDLL